MKIDEATAALIWEWIDEICDVAYGENAEVAKRLRAELATFLGKK